MLSADINNDKWKHSNHQRVVAKGTTGKVCRCDDGHHSTQGLETKCYCISLRRQAAQSEARAGQLLHLDMQSLSLCSNEPTVQCSASFSRQLDQLVLLLLRGLKHWVSCMLEILCMTAHASRIIRKPARSQPCG